LVYVDYALVNDEVVSTLTSEGYTVTVATSWSNFNTLLAGGTDLAVAFAQNYSQHPEVSTIALLKVIFRVEEK